MNSSLEYELNRQHNDTISYPQSVPLPFFGSKGFVSWLENHHPNIVGGDPALCPVFFYGAQGSGGRDPDPYGIEEVPNPTTCWRLGGDRH